MTNHSGSAGSMPADEARPNWEWIRERIPASGRERYESWLLSELAELEAHFAKCITPKSRQRALRSDFSRDRG